ncbi:glycosyl hydrolase family 61-domain-containing protein [Phellopilus nigrolimitatus]|nr:glycosyl hydrolase family 61-domain-containing protein [Phellopilus nigrolimitatus]KAH8113986.1 glycosyl hydrolase family 61-domain-containing protein [Phellopilus nigrolimitatus]
MLSSVAVLASLFASAAAHATFQEMWVNGVDQGSWCVRLPQSNSPVTSVSTPDLACNANASPSSGICSVTPGDQVTVEMHQQPDSRSCADQAIGGDHWGPVLAYMAKVDDATTAVGSSSSWFKVSEMGLPSNNPEYWGTEVLNDNCGHYTFTVPADIAPGQYLLRAEVIALHVASSVGGAQFYMSCFQIEVGGSGTVDPPTVDIPGVYGASDPGILIDIYTSPTAYTIPGPTPYGTTSPAVATTAWPTAATWNTAEQPTAVPNTQPPDAGAPPASSAPAAPTSASSVAAPPSPTASSTSASATATGAAGSIAMYGQCGGIGWTGATGCVSGATCTVVNDYYYQCLAA